MMIGTYQRMFKSIHHFGSLNEFKGILGRSAPQNTALEHTPYEDVMDIRGFIDRAVVTRSADPNIDSSSSKYACDEQGD